MTRKIYTIDEIKSILKEILKDEPVYKVILFGSYAKGEATSKSDLDFMIDTRETLMGFALLKVICKIEDKFKKDIDCFEKYEIIPESRIDKEIQKTGVVVYER